MLQRIKNHFQDILAKMSKISGEFQISGHFWNFRNFRTALKLVYHGANTPENRSHGQLSESIWIKNKSNKENFIKISNNTEDDNLFVTGFIA